MLLLVRCGRRWARRSLVPAVHSPDLGQHTETLTSNTVAG